MSLRRIAGPTLAGCIVVACSTDPPSNTMSEGVGGTTGGATGAASGSAGAGGSGASNPSNSELAVTLLGPSAGTAFERRRVNVEVAFSAPTSGTQIVLEQGGSVIEERMVGPEEAGTTSISLPLLRGATPFAISLVSPDGKSITLKSHLYGGRPIAAALDMGIAVHDGSIVRWGGGDPNLELQDTPTGVTSVADGAGGVFALDAAGHVYFASGSEGPFELMDGLEDITAIAPGGGHALFLRADGALFGAGANDRGQLGTGDVKSHAEVVAILPLNEIMAIAASDDSSFAVGANGELYAWGSNEEGQLGLGDEDASPHPKPLIVPSLVDAIDVAAGRNHVLAVTTEGRVYVWGQGTSGQLGDGSSGILASKSQPVPIELPDRALAVAAKGNVSFAVLASGELFGWGQNSLAQLGVGDTSPRTKPTLCLVGVARAVEPGAVSSLAIDDAGVLYAWGSNASGQLGLPPPPDGPERSSTPVEVSWP